MRRIILIGLATAALATAPSTNASEPIQLEHFAPLPCSVACAYWDAGGAAGFDECAKPFPAGSYDVTRLRITEDRQVVQIDATSVIDYDTFACTTEGRRIDFLACGRMQKCSQTGGRCNGVAGIDEIAVGCTETIWLTLNALHGANDGLNDEFLLISYNWSDYAPLPITITGPAEVIDDSFDATIP